MCCWHTLDPPAVMSNVQPHMACQVQALCCLCREQEGTWWRCWADQHAGSVAEGAWAVSPNHVDDHTCSNTLSLTHETY
jgi:hypothetical protein